MLSRKQRQIVTLFCLLFFQCQVWAAAWSSCQHSRVPVPDSTVKICPKHQKAQSSDADPSSDLGCAQCTLCCAVGHTFREPDLAPAPLLERVVETRYFTVPTFPAAPVEPLFRPPIAFRP
jgi:hypothetical protein